MFATNADQSATSKSPPIGAVTGVPTSLMLESALGYAARGWPVLPLAGKVPAISRARGGHGVHDATADPDLIRGFWTKWPNSNIGLATGPASDIWVLDVDGEDGERALLELEQALGALPPTVEAITGKGRHIYFRHTGEPIRNRVSDIGPGLDVRADGGYVVVPPSMHPSTGQQYRWKPGHGPDDVAPAVAPDWLVQMVCATNQDRQRTRMHDAALTVGTDRNDAARAHANFRIRDFAHQIAMAPAGKQEETLNRLAFTAGRDVGAGWIEFDSAKQLLLAGARRMPNYRPQEPWSDQKIAEKIERGLLDGMTKTVPPAAHAELGHNRQGFSSDDLTAELAGLDPSDTGNAHRLIRRFGDRILFVVGVGWHIWDGRRWLPDDAGEVTKFAQETARRIADECSVMTGTDMKLRAKWAIQSQNRGHVEAMLAMAAPHCAVLADEMDADPMLLNVGNGTLDLRTGALRPHSPADQITKLVPIDFDPAAKAPLFERFLDEIFGGDIELVDFVHRMMGYCLSGLTKEQVLFILHGGGSNGKSTFIAVLAAIVGEYGQQAPPQTFMASEYGDRIPNDVARLRGARFASVSETGEGRKLNETLIKQATGGDRLTARFLHREFFEFSPQFKLCMATNHRPQIQGTDDAIWRRIRLVPFERQFLDPEKAGPGQPVKDKGLLDKLMAELPGILAIAVRGCLAYQRDGLPSPKKVMLATEEYRREMDKLADFIANCCIEGSAYSAGATDLFAAYEAYCRDVACDAMSQTMFGTLMGKRGFKTDNRGPGGRTVRRGIALKTKRQGSDAASDRTVERFRRVITIFFVTEFAHF